MSPPRVQGSAMERDVPRGRRAQPWSSRGAAQAHGPTLVEQRLWEATLSAGGGDPHHCAVAPACRSLGSQSHLPPRPALQKPARGGSVPGFGQRGAAAGTPRTGLRRLPGKQQTPLTPRQAWCSGLAGPRRSEAGAPGRGRPNPCRGPTNPGTVPATFLIPRRPRGRRGRGGPEAWGTEGVGKAGDPVLWGWRLHGEGAQARGGTGRASLATGTRAGGETGAHG
ncbi:unnamed protein product [Rangifer tarandus platyrhynchus]|uniref:Uncharacterized protein n=2 Tax=Rangifer tarandus platyrhynchus TaxID=3082113 RepID=A0ACB0F410_RANTA|nr:unnamed protein product [Rangifer tarandus platyrhynchus]CAI9707614.1 unnamed protein product [Rangifer tarandus platyrhynchus]